MTQKNDIETLTKIALNAALKAGKAILDVYYNLNFDIEIKPDKSPLTIADKRAHNIITEFLKQTKIPVLSEEGKSIDFNERKEWEMFWLVDPLDGTKEFIKRNGEFTVNIALIENCSPIAGVVYVPVSKEMYYANCNGSFKCDFDEESNSLKNIQKLPLKGEKEFFVIAGSKSHMNAETETFIQKLDTYGKPVKMISKGSSLKICMAAAGEVDVYPRLAPTMEWDTAAAHAIVKFAGKNIFQFDSNMQVVYNKENQLNPWFVVK